MGKIIRLSCLATTVCILFSSILFGGKVLTPSTDGRNAGADIVSTNTNSADTMNRDGKVCDVPTIIEGNANDVEITRDGRAMVKNSPVSGINVNKHQKLTHRKNSIVSNSDLIVFVQYSDDASVSKTLSNLQLTLKRIIRYDGTIIAHNPKGLSISSINKLAEADDNVLYIMENCIRMAQTDVRVESIETNDKYFNQQWALTGEHGVDIEGAWETTTGSSDIKVAVLDTGLAQPNVEFEGRIYKQYDVADNDNDASDNSDFSHGSHVAGIIAANSNNEVGIAGITSFVNLLIIDCFAYNEELEDEVADDEAIFSAYSICINEGVNVANMSFGGAESDMDFFSISIYASKLKKMKSNNIISVVAAGNESTDAAVLPSDDSSVISVIATDESGNRCSFSNYGSKKDISAPGKSIVSCGTKDTFVLASGTSMAAPIVSGVVALLLSRKPDLTMSQVEDIIYSTTDLHAGMTRGTKDNNYGYGIINATAAMELLNNTFFPGWTPNPNGIVFVASTPGIQTPDAATPTPANTQGSEVQVTDGTDLTTDNPASPDNAGSSSDAVSTNTPSPKPGSTYGPETSPALGASASPNVSAAQTPSVLETILPLPTKSVQPSQIKKIKFAKKRLTIKIGKMKTAKLKLTISPAGKNLSKQAARIKWSVSRKKIVKLSLKTNKSIRIKGMKKGKIKLIAYNPNFSKKSYCWITIKK